MENTTKPTDYDHDLFYQRINDNLVRVIGDVNDVAFNIFVLTPKQAEKAERDYENVIEQFVTTSK